MVAASPNLRRRGVGRALYEQFIADVRSRGVGRVTAITWPGNRASVVFHEAIGFRLVDGPGTQSIYGVPAFTDYDDDRDDKAVMVREL
jgi:L-amino acid N-acyltransferase YncA